MIAGLLVFSVVGELDDGARSGRVRNEEMAVGSSARLIGLQHVRLVKVGPADAGQGARVNLNEEVGLVWVTVEDW